MLKRTRTSLVLLFFFLSIYLGTMSGVIQYGDEAEKYLVAQSLVERQDFAFRPTVMRNEVGVGGRSFSVYELGTSLVEVPFYALGRWLTGFIPVPDTNWITMLSVGLMNPLLTAIACVLFFKTCLRLKYRLCTSLVLALVYGLATIAFPYSRDFSREPLMTVLILGLVYGAVAFRQTQDRHWLGIIAITAAALVFTKLIQAAILPIFLVYLYACLRESHAGHSDRSSRRRDIALALAVIAIPIAVAVGLQMVYAYSRFGTIYGGIGGTRINPIEVILSLIRRNDPIDMGTRLLFSPDRSIFLYSPPILLSPIAWFLWRRSKRWEAYLVLGLILITFLAAALRPDGDAGGWWGARYFVQITSLFLLPLGAMLESADRIARRWWIGALGALSFVGLAVQVLGVFTSSRDHLDIIGYGPTILNQIIFLQHGALDSLLITLTPLRINSFAVILLVTVVLLGVRIVAEITSEVEFASHRRENVLISSLMAIVEVFGFLTWVVAPYPRVLADRANTKYGAADRFLAEGNSCVANALYLKALNGGTDFPLQAAARVNASLGLNQGEEISADDLIASVEAESGTSAEFDAQVRLAGAGTIKISAPTERESTITILSQDQVVSPGRSYRVSGWARLLDVYGAGNMFVTIYEDDGSYRRTRATDISAKYQTAAWQPFWGTITTLPTTRRLILKIGLWKTFGTVWVGDVYLAPAEPSTDTADGVPPPCSL